MNRASDEVLEDQRETVAEAKPFLRAAIALLIFLRYQGRTVKDSFEAADAFVEELDSSLK